MNDYVKSGGTMKDRRWAEGSTLANRRGREGKEVYVMTYSCNK